MVLNIDKEKLNREVEDATPSIVTERGSSNRSVSRLNFLRLGILGGFSLLGWRLWDLQKPLEQDYTADNGTKTAPSTDLRYITTKPPRGIVYDRNKQRLVVNQAIYSVTLTADALPDADKAKDKKEREIILRQRQDVYDNLARFLGMGYYVAIIPEQVNGLRDKQGQFTNSERNAILNKLEVLTGISAVDWDKRLSELARQNRDKTLLVINDKEPYSVEQFDRYKGLREEFKVTSGVFFLSEGQRKMVEAEFFTPPYQPVEVWQNLSREEAMWLDERRLDFPGVNVQTSYIRQYEDPRLYAHIMGYTGRFRSQEGLEKANKESEGDLLSGDPQDPTGKVKTYSIDDRIGVTGIEGWAEPFLRGRKGVKEVKVDASGHILATISEGKPAQPGNNVYLTIDSKLQTFVANSLERWIDEANKKNKKPKFKEGAAVVMNVNTGEVLAMVAFPFYNNNLYSLPFAKWSQAERKDMADDEKSVETNRALKARYAPGSTFKLLTAVAVLNEKKFSRFTTIDCTRYIQIPTNVPTQSQSFRCWEKHGTLDIVGAIENSCDIFFYNAGVEEATSQFYGRNRYNNKGSAEINYFRGTGITPLNGYMRLFNMGQPTGIEIPGEYAGSLPGPYTNPKWSIGDTMTTSIGQGDVEMTPLQVCMMTAAFANGGKLFQPRLIREVKDTDGKEVLPFEAKLIRNVTKDPVKWRDVEFRIEPAVLQVVREGMLAVTSTPRGTASRLMANGQMGSLKVAGKTGTAEYGEVIGEDKDGNETRASRAWFTAFAPYDKPEYAITVIITSDGDEVQGSTYAVPVAKEILQFLYPEQTKVKA